MTGKTREGLNPGWLFLTIIVVLLGPYVFLGVSLRVCTQVLSRETQILLDKIERLPADTPYRFSENLLNESKKTCSSLSDQFRNARNKALEILLGLVGSCWCCRQCWRSIKTKAPKQNTTTRADTTTRRQLRRALTP